MSRRSLAISLILLLLVGTTGAVAKGSRKLTVVYPVELNGKVLEAGNYKIELAHQSEPTVVFYRDGEEVARATYKAVTLPEAPKSDRIVYRMNQDGSRELLEIRLKGQKDALSFRN